MSYKSFYRTGSGTNTYKDLTASAFVESRTERFENPQLVAARGKGYYLWVGGVMESLTPASVSSEPSLGALFTPAAASAASYTSTRWASGFVPELND